MDGVRPPLMLHLQVIFVCFNDLIIRLLMIKVLCDIPPPLYLSRERGSLKNKK